MIATSIRMLKFKSCHGLARFLNEINADLSGKFGSLIMFGFSAFAAWRWYRSWNFFFALLCLRDLIAAIYIGARPQGKVSVPIWVKLIAYVSSFLPFLYFGSDYGSWKFLNLLDLNGTHILIMLNLSSRIFMISGFLISTLAIIELGDSMGVSPAFRSTLRTGGIYHYFKHPMYLGYLLAEFGVVLLNPLNIFIFFLSSFGYWTRMRIEDKILR